MGIKARRKIYRMGNSKSLSIPPELVTGKEHTMAADRIIIIDPLGEISEDSLHDFLENEVEPLFRRRFFSETNQNEGAQAPLL